MYLLKMKTKIYNNLIFSLLFVCSICGLFGGVGVFAQDQQSSAETAPTTENIRRGDPTILNLYSSIWGAERINTTDASQEAVSGLIQKFFTRFFRVIFTVSGILMVVMLAVHGTQMIYAEFTGNVSGFSDAKKRVVAAAIGTIILLLSWIILDFIDPSLLRPQLFKTITQLREVGQGNNLVTANLSVPDKAVNYDKETGLLTISACPDIEDNFKGQVESVRQSLQQGPYSTTVPLQYHYQILYSDFGGEVKVSEEGEDRAFDKIRDQSEGGDSLVGVRKCTSEPQTKIKATIKNSDIIAVFPIVSIVVKKDEKDPGKVVKFWRGKPWRHKPKFDADDCITLGKDHIKLKGSITARPLLNNEALINNNHGGNIVINFPTIEKSGRIFNSIEGAVTGYHIDNNDVKYCTTTGNVEDKSCSGNGGTYKTASKSKEVEFKITSSTAGERLVIVGESIKHQGIFRITPMLVPVDEKGKKIGQCKEPLRGETACFEITRAGDKNDGNVDDVGPAKAGCDDTSTIGSTHWEGQAKGIIVEKVNTSLVDIRNPVSSIGNEGIKKTTIKIKITGMEKLEQGGFETTLNNRRRGSRTGFDVAKPESDNSAKSGDSFYNPYITNIEDVSRNGNKAEVHTTIEVLFRDFDKKMCIDVNFVMAGKERNDISTNLDNEPHCFKFNEEKGEVESVN